MPALPNQNERRFSFGFYFYAKGRTRFLGWGNPFAKKNDRPIASLADWLRMMHSASSLSTAQSTSSAQSQESSASKTFFHWQEST